MNKYGRAAIAAYDLITKQNLLPKDAWELSVKRLFPDSPVSRKRPCPKNAFLGLCQVGHLKNIPKDMQAKSRSGFEYTIRGLNKLKKDPSLASNKYSLWLSVTNGLDKKHNHQMDVLLALWNRGCIKI